MSVRVYIELPVGYSACSRKMGSAGCVAAALTFV